jgi:hypothetical protein
MNRWRMVRVAVMSLGFLGGTLANPVPAPPEGFSAPLLVGAFFFGIIGVLFLIGIQRGNPHCALIWRYPSWSINPFLFREPLQFFHLGGFFFLSSGAGILLHFLFLGWAFWFSALVMPVFGAGILCGVYACTRLYRGKMVRT